MSNTTPPSPSHQDIANEIASRMHDFSNRGVAFTSPGGLMLQGHGLIGLITRERNVLRREEAAAMREEKVAKREAEVGEELPLCDEPASKYKLTIVEREGEVAERESRVFTRERAVLARGMALSQERQQLQHDQREFEIEKRQLAEEQRKIELARCKQASSRQWLEARRWFKRRKA